MKYYKKEGCKSTEEEIMNNAFEMNVQQEL